MSAPGSAIVRAIGKLIERRDLARDEMADVVGQIMDGGATPAQIGGLLVALRAKGEVVDELVGAATAMRARAIALRCPAPERGIDTCGTGGDGAGTINVSTLAAILLAASGAVVAKHGNRAQSSKCGSADVLEALGIAVDTEPAIVERCMAEAGIGFAYAPRFHAATRYAGPARKELGTRTIFNLLGPLTNPAAIAHQVVGVFEARWCEPMAAALGALGVRRAAVVHGAGGIDERSESAGGGGPNGSADGAGGRAPRGIDEIAVRGATRVAIFDGGSTSVAELTPAAFGVADADPAGLAGGDAAHNAAILRAVLAGTRIDAVLQAAAMTAALGLELLEPGPLDLARLPAHYRRAAATARDGSAARVVERWAAASAAVRT